MKICEQIKVKMLDGSRFSEEETRHAGTCPDCREFAALVKRMKSLSVMEQEVPVYLDKAVLQAASDSMPKPRWNPVIWKIAIPLAASFVFVVGLLFYRPAGVLIEQTPSVITKHSVTRQNTAIKKTVKRVNNPVQSETTFDEQILALAMDVGSEIGSFPESFDSVSETIDSMI